MNTFRGILIVFLLIIANIGHASSIEGVRAIEIRDVKVNPDGGVGIISSFRSDLGLPIDQIDASRLFFEIDGKRIPTAEVSAQSFGQTNKGVAILFAVDVSGSMAEGLPLIRDSLKRYILQLRNSNDAVGIGAIADKWEPRLELTTNSDAAIKTIDSLSGESKTTALFESIYEGTRLLSMRGNQVPSRRIIVVVSDGVNEKAGRTAQHCIDLARTTFVQIHSIIFGARSTAQTLAARGELEMISIDSGGQTYTIDHPSRIASVIEQIRETVAQEVVISLPGTFMPKDGLEHTLRLGYEEVSVQLPIRAILENKENVSETPSNPRPVWRVWIDNLEKALQARSWILWLVVAAIGIIGIWIALLINARLRAKEENVRDEQEPKSELLRSSIKNADVRVLNEGKSDNKGAVATHSEAEVKKTQAARRTEYRANDTKSQRRKILILNQNVAVRVFELVDGEINIGANDVNDLVIDEPTVSGVHAKIININQELKIVDLGSTNGTYVEDVRVQAQPVTVNTGQKIRIGLVILEVR